MFGNFFKNKKILVTGHTGFQGSWLVLWLKLLGAEVTGISLPPPTKPSFFKSLKLENVITHKIIDIRDLTKLKKTIELNQPEIIFHLAAQSLVRKSYKKPLETFSTNILGTVNILECIRSSTTVKGCIIFTSDKSYENIGIERAYKENDRLGGNDPYSASKAAAEIITTAYRNSFFNENDNAKIATIRAGNVIGGGDWAEDRLIPDFVRAITNKEKIKIRNPEHTRPWQFVLEPLCGMLWLATKIVCEQKFSQAWNFGPPIERKQYTVNKLLGKICSEWKINESIIKKIPNANLHEDKFLNIDSSKAKKLLGLKPVYNLEKTITETVDWYKYFLENENDIKNFSIQQIKNFVNNAKQSNLSWTN